MGPSWKGIFGGERRARRCRAPTTDRLSRPRLVGLGEGVFVGAGAVDGGDGDLEEAQVDGELAAVVIPVVEHDVADQLDAGNREDFLAICLQAPGRGGCGFGQAFDELLGGLYAAFEGVENLFLIFGLLRGEGGRIDFVHVVWAIRAMPAGTVAM